MIGSWGMYQGATHWTIPQSRVMKGLNVIVIWG